MLKEALPKVHIVQFHLCEDLEQTFYPSIYGDKIRRAVTSDGVGVGLNWDRGRENGAMSMFYILKAFKGDQNASHGILKICAPI